MRHLYVVVACDGEYSGRTWSPVLIVETMEEAQEIATRLESLHAEKIREARALAALPLGDARRREWYTALRELTPRYDSLAEPIIGTGLSEEYEVHEVEFRVHPGGRAPSTGGGGAR